MIATDRLSALDAAFIALESERVPFAIGSILTFDRALDLDRLRAHVDAALDHLPRYRQRLARVPVLRHPVWVDDSDFRIDRHVQAVPDEWAALSIEDAAARLLTRGLPREHPPWQLWLSGGPGRRSAVIAVVHHALVDGISGVRLLEHLLSGVANEQVAARAPRAPGRPPSGAALLGAELRHRARGLRRLGDHLPRDPRDVARALVDLVADGLHPASDAGINPRQTSRARVLASWTVELAAMREVRQAFGATVNDIVLATIAGALRRFVARDGADPAALGDLRAMVPTSTSRPGDQAVSGNQVVLLLTHLAIDEADPVRRLTRTVEVTRALKDASRQAAAGELLLALSDVTTPALLSGVLRLALWRRAFNLVITNVPGPPFPLYLLGARLERIVPIVNLWPHGGVAIAVISYQGTLSWGVHADRALIADLAPFVHDLAESFDELRAAAARAPGATG